MTMTRSRSLLRLTLSLALGLAPIALRAQEHAATAHEVKTATGHAEAQAPEAPAAGEHGPADHGRDTVHEAAHEPGATHEASQGQEGAGREGGHHGPVIKLFGHELGDLSQWLVQLLNFLVFAGGIFFLAKGPLSAAFKARQKELEEKLAQAEKDKAEGEAQMRELEAKMAGLEGELKGIMAKAGEDAEAEKQRVLEAAAAESATILAQASTEIEHQKKQAVQELRALVAELAVEAASQRIEAQVQGATASTVADRAISKIGGIQ